jgi:parvulin-like peptidyl-prolyl isomerase
VDRDISLRLDAFPNRGVTFPELPLASATAAAIPELPPDPGEIEPEDLGDPLWRALARHELLVPLLRQSLIARAIQDVRLTDEERNLAQQAWARRHGIRSAEQLHAHLAARGLEEAEACWQAELPHRIQRHCAAHFSHRAEQRFLARKAQLDQVIYSLLRVKDASLARELYLRIAEGEADFAELAATYSQGPEQATRGIVGPVPLLQAHPVLAERLRTSRPGELQAPVAIEQWWLVFRLERLHSASFDEEMGQRMAQELFEEWVDEEVRQQIASRAAQR